MYNYIIGKITDRTEGILVLENNNIGYEIYVSTYTLKALENEEGEVKIYIYYQQREDGVTLYGFCDKNERQIFLKLISVSGVGPKGAMAILSNIKPDDLCKVIARQDLIALSSVKGIGKKTAERLLVELKDKVDILPLEAMSEQTNINIENREIDDACQVLMSLGLTKIESVKLAREAYKQGDSAEDIIQKSLFLIKK